MELGFLKTLVIIFGVSASVIYLLHRVRVPSIVGFLAAGVLLGPHGFGLVRDIREVELLAEIGVILLLFTIGLEISLKNLKRIRSAVLGGGLSQVLLTFLLTAALSYPFLERWNSSLFAGFLVALSSTAIVMKMLFDRGEIDTPHGRLSIAILIFQDLCVVPLMLLIPILSGGGGNPLELLWMLFKSAAIIFLVIFGARSLVPHLLHQIVHTRSRELFVITIILLCLGTALLTSWLGLSLALGAFLAGLIISESEYAYQAISDILPFKESFNGLFFISIGMLMNLLFLREHILSILLCVVLILLLKTFTGFLSVHLMGHPVRISLQTGIHLAQIGEFSFVLAVAGKSAGLLSESHYQIFLSTSVMTMILTPFLIQASPTLSAYVSSKRLLHRLDRMRRRAEKEMHLPGRKDHVIIIGFGLNGRNVAEVLRETSIPYVVLDLNNETVREMRKKGEPIFYGDGTSPEILHKLGLATARMLVVVISDPASTRRIVQLARKENPRIYIIVRTRYIAEVEDLLQLGANEVIPEEFETSIEIFAKVLHRYQVPRNLINEQIERIRSRSYETLRRVELPVRSLPEKCELITDIETESYLIGDGTPAVGRSIRDLKIRSRTGATVIAVRRNGEVLPSPEPDFLFKAGDVVYLIGEREKVLKAIELIETPP
ncbi:MAG: cation:proton antiporter [Desulfobacterota bacterium]|nr:cation:proton antiporter [Thermodesulfobacteriota bacterium]